MTTLRIGQWLRTAAKVLILPLLGLLVGFGAAAITTAAIAPTYQATASVIVLPNATSSDQTRLTNVSLAQNLVSSVAQLAESGEVAQEAATILKVPRTSVEGQISGVSQPGTQIVIVQASARTAAGAQAMANAATKAMIAVSNRLHLGGTSVSVVSLDQAGPAGNPISPRPVLNYALGAFVGLLIGIGFVSLRARTGNRFRRVADIESELGLPAFGVINVRTPVRRFRSARKLYARQTIHHAVGGLVAAVSVLVEKNPGRRIVVTSVDQESTAAFVASLLAIGLRQDDHRVTLLEAKGRRPAVHRYFPDAADRSVSDVLGRSRHADNADTVSDLPTVLTPGALDDFFERPNYSDQVGALIDTIAANGDDIVVTASPVLAGRALAELAHHADLVILAIDSDRVNRAEAGRAALLVQRLRVPLAGIVVTGSAADEDGWQPTAWPAANTAPRVLRTMDHSSDLPPALPFEPAPALRTAPKQVERIAERHSDLQGELPTRIGGR